MSAPTTITDRWPATHAGVQLRRGPSCWAYAMVNAAIAANVPDADRFSADALFRMACEIDGVDPEINRTRGTTGSAILDAFSRLVPDRTPLPISPATAESWVRDYGPVAASLRWRYPRVGVVGSTLRRQPGIGDGTHSVALLGHDPRHRTGLFRCRPCFLVMDSTRPSFRLWLPVADFLLDAVECYGFTAGK